METDPEKGIAELIRALRRDAPAVGESVRPAPAELPIPQAPPAAGAPAGQGGPPPAGPRAPGSGQDLDDYLMRRLEVLEAEVRKEGETAAVARARLEAQQAGRSEAEAQLRLEREAAALARAKFEVQQANRSEVEEQLRALSDALKRERETSHASGRIEALEARLDKMHETWTAALQAMLGELRQAPARDREGSEAMKAVSRQLEALAAALPNAAGSGVASLEARLDKMQAAWESASSQARAADRETGAGLNLLSAQLGSAAASLSASLREQEGAARRMHEETGLAFLVLEKSYSRLADRLAAMEQEFARLRRGQRPEAGP